MKALLALALVASAGGCASSRGASAAATTSPTVGPSDQTVTSDLDRGRDSQVVYVKNSASATVVVTAVRLYDCTNVSNFCGMTPLQVRVAPRARVAVLVIRPLNSQLPYFYKYDWAWNAASP